MAKMKKQMPPPNLTREIWCRVGMTLTLPEPISSYKTEASLVAAMQKVLVSLNRHDAKLDGETYIPGCLLDEYVEEGRLDPIIFDGDTESGLGNLEMEF